MTHLRPSNFKLQERALRMIREATGMSEEEAATYLQEYGQVYRAVLAFNQKNQSAPST